MTRKKNQLAPIHPGGDRWGLSHAAGTLQDCSDSRADCFQSAMKGFELGINRLARDLDVPPTRIHGIVNGRRSVTADTALRLAQYFEVSPETWLSLQTDYDLRVAKRASGDKIRARVRGR